MGQKYLFKCLSCKNEIMCSLGLDRGFKHQVRPMLCRGCNTVKNRVTGKINPNSINIELINPCCDSCNSGEKLEDWDTKTCPKCNQEEIMYYKFPTIPWD